MLEIKNLTFSYPRQKSPTIDNMSFSVAEGGVYGLLGPNGAGKSTLLYLISGLLTPRSGDVELNGTDTRLRRPSTLSDIFLVPEEFSLPSVKLSTYVAHNSCFYPNFSHRDMKRHLELFEIEGDPDLGALSMGQKKKVYMSFALACNTPLLLMDEPTNGLDIPGKVNFRRFIASNMTDSRSIIISTHQVADINRLLDHVIILNNRDVLLNASTEDIVSRLDFINTDDPELIAKALYAQQSLSGASIILPAAGDNETEINLETLFSLATGHPDVIKKLFTAKSSEQ